MNDSILSQAEKSKKMVRFADSFGFDLEKVKIITNKSFDWTPSQFEGDTLSDSLFGDEIRTNVVSKPFLVLIPLFGLKQKHQISEIIKLDEFKFDHENAIIKCIIKVKNISFQKRVFARISFNLWQTFADLDAIYVRSSSSQDADYFGFCVVIPRNLKITRIEFAVCLKIERDLTFWDNNGGENYKFQCFFNNDN